MWLHITNSIQIYIHCNLVISAVSFAPIIVLARERSNVRILLTMKGAVQEIKVIKSKNQFSRIASERDKDDLKAALNEIKLNMISSTLVGDAVSTHGFSTQLIEDVVSNCSVLFTVGDVLHTCPVFSLSHAIMILEIIQDIFNDIPNFDQSMNMIGNENIQAYEIDYFQKVLEEVAVDSFLDTPEDEEDELPEVWS